MSTFEANRCEQADLVWAYALQAGSTAGKGAIEAHVASCRRCQRDLEVLWPVVGSFAAWPTDVLRPAASLQERLARRLSLETGEAPVAPPAATWREPDWQKVAPGISVKLLAT